MGLLEDFEEDEIEEKPVKKEEPEEEVVERKGFRIESEEDHISVTTGDTAKYKVEIINDTGDDHVFDIKGHIIYSVEKEKRIPWNVDVLGEKDYFQDENIFHDELKLADGENEILPVKVKPPVGARYGEKLEVVIDVTSKKDTLVSDSVTLITAARPTIVAVKTQIGQEKNVADYLSALNKSSDQELGIFSILSPKPVRGYVFMEVMSPDRIADAVDGMRRAKGVVEGETDLEEVEHFLAPKLAVEGIAEGDIVELSAGPFKGEKARVTKIDEDNDEITVELFEATVPIPVTVRGDHVRVLEKE